jgi:hypothetical protein
MAGKPINAEEEVKELTAQFYVTLRAYVARLGPEAATRAPKAHQDVDALLNSDTPSWSDAYQIEQLLVDLFDEPTLDIELQGRLLEARAHLQPKLAEHYEQLAQVATTSAARRAILARLLNDLQWRHTVNEVKRMYSKDVSKSTGLIFIVTVALFAATIFVLAFFRNNDWRANNAVLLMLAGVVGGWGAGFSMVASLKSRLDAAGFDDLKLMRSRWIQWSRPLIGVGAAGILYFFLISGLLEGPAFPRLAVAPGTDITPKDLALMIVWCFLAGFSERLVPALLAKTEDGSSAPPPSEPMRFKPDDADVAHVLDSKEPPRAAGV